MNAMLQAEFEVFVAQYGFDPNALDSPREYGMTPLMRVALLGRVDLVQLLLERGVDRHACNADGNDALWLACVSNRVDVVACLVDAGLDVNHQNQTGATALMYAASSGKDILVALLLARGADPYLVNQDGAMAVDTAATLSCLKLLRHSAA